MAETKIREGLEYIRKHGWHQGSSYGPGGKACLMAGICQAYEAVDGQVEPMTADFLTVNIVASELFPGRVGYLALIAPAAQFNDHPNTTFSDVEVVMEKAAIRREEAVE